MSRNSSGSTTGLVNRMGEKFHVEPAKVLETLKATAFKQRDGSAPSNQEMMALLIVADQYGLNPFTREIYAFQDKQAGIVPVVGLDGWVRIVNEHPQYDGCEFVYSEDVVTPENGKPCPEWVECIMYRKDREHAVVVREYLDECYRPPFKKNDRTIKGPWQTHTKRFMRHRAFIQNARICFGFTGVADENDFSETADTGGRVFEGSVVPVDAGSQTPAKGPEARMAALAADTENADEGDGGEPEAIETGAPALTTSGLLEEAMAATTVEKLDELLDLTRSGIPEGQRDGIVRAIESRKKQIEGAGGPELF